jgi:hypothetical protein
LTLTIVQLYYWDMSIEQNNSQEKIINNESVQEVVRTEVISEEDKQAKIEKKVQNKIDDDKRINEIRNELIGENNSEISGSEAYDIYSKWKESEIQKIKLMATETEGQVKSSAISDRGPVAARDSNFSLIDLENSGELKFIQFASNEGNKKDISAAIKLVDLYYRDRTDLKEKLLNKVG